MSQMRALKYGFRTGLPLLVAGVLFASASCGGGDDSALTIYSGRTQELVEPILERFSDETGIKIRVRYGDTGELASTILEEGGNSPADVFFAQDAGALGAVDAEGRLAPLPEDLLELVPAGYRADDGDWVGISGRSRVVVYNTDEIQPEDLPDAITGFTSDEWEGRIGWVPTNASFQSFVTAFRLLEGDEAARAWLEGIKDNNPVDLPNNSAAVEAVANGEVDVAFVNHYYLFRFLAEQGEDFKARNYFMKNGDVGALVNVAGAGILDSSDHKDDAARFIEYMLQVEAQQYFANETYEYPLIEGVEVDPLLTPLSELRPPQLDLSELSDLEGTQQMLRDTGVLP
jgi:iron(III) transport system substrate-binding protein